MIAWVLIIALGTTSSMTISSIASEKDCRELGEKIMKIANRLPFECLPYRSAHGLGATR
jgi:hypothetical protein